MYPTWELFNPLAFYFYLFEIPARYCSEILRHTGAFTVTQWIWICGQHELKLCLIPLYLPRRGRSFTLASLSYGTCVLPLEKFVLKSIDSLAKQKVHPLTTNIALVSCRRRRHRHPVPGATRELKLASVYLRLLLNSSTTTTTTHYPRVQERANLFQIQDDEHLVRTYTGESIMPKE